MLALGHVIINRDVARKGLVPILVFACLLIGMFALSIGGVDISLAKLLAVFRGG